jgi:hypothetical protein
LRSLGPRALRSSVSAHRASPDESLVETAAATKAFFDAVHAAVIALVVVAEEMQESVKREDAQLGGFTVARVARLALRHSARDHDVAEKTLHHGGHGGRRGQKRF